MSLLAFQNHTWPAGGGGGGNPSLVGGAGGTTRVNSTTVPVPIHASSAEGQTCIIVFTHSSDDSGSGTVTLPSGWNQVGTRQVSSSALSVDVYEGPLSAGMISAGEVSISFSTTVERHGLSLTFADAGTVSGFSGATGSGGGLQTMPSITVVEGAMTIGAIAIRNALNTITMTPTAVASSYPTGSTAQSIAATVVADESAGSSSSITAAYAGGPFWVKISLQVEPV